MKNLLPLFFFTLSFNTYAQVNAVMPPEATSFYNSAMQKIKPELKTSIEKNAQKLKGRNINIDSLFVALHKDPSLKNSNQYDLHAIAVLIMVQISKNADADLKSLVVERKNNDADATEISEKIISNKRQIAENVSSVMKKLPGTPETLIDELR